jgi:nitrite transporter NirC
MFRVDVDSISKAAADKAALSKNRPFTYFMRAIVAGFYIVVATILSNVAAAILKTNYGEFSSLLGAYLFATAIILIVFLGGELFTGNNMTMMMGLYCKKVKVRDVIRVFVYSYLGNFIGCFILGTIFYFTGCKQDILTSYYASVIPAKLEPTWLQIFLRGILCNFMVCIAVLTGTRMKTESGKITLMYMVIMCFVLTGFEHCIANMGTFTIAAWMLGGLDWLLVFKNMFFATLGNIIGGGFLLTWSLKAMSCDE